MASTVEPISDSNSAAWRFGDFVFVRKSLALYLRGKRVQLDRRPAGVLCDLLVQGGNPVSRQQLYDKHWPSKDARADLSLNAAIRQIRRALEDDAASPRYIKTIPRHGYQFVSAAPAVSDAEISAPITRRSQKMIVAAALVATIALAVFLVWPGSVQSRCQSSVVVLYPLQANCETGNCIRYFSAARGELHSSLANVGSTLLNSQRRPLSVVIGENHHADAELALRTSVSMKESDAEGAIYVELLGTDGQIVLARRYDVSLEDGLPKPPVLGAAIASDAAEAIMACRQSN